MRVFKLIPIFVLFLLLSGGQVMLMSSPAYAACCACGKCSPRCTSCCACMVIGCVEQFFDGDEFTLKAGHSEPVRIVAERDVLDKVKKLGRKGCGNFQLSFIGNLKDGLLFRCTDFTVELPDSYVDKVERMTKEFETAQESDIPDSDPARGKPVPQR